MNMRSLCSKIKIKIKIKIQRKTKSLYFVKMIYTQPRFPLDIKTALLDIDTMSKQGVFKTDGKQYESCVTCAKNPCALIIAHIHAEPKSTICSNYQTRKPEQSEIKGLT